MKLMIGLGNPGGRYQKTRHNVGYRVVDFLKTYLKNRKDILTVKSRAFMNDSGTAVKKLISRHRNFSLSDLYVIHDDLDLPLGTWKMQYAKGPKDNNGIKDIEEKLGTKNFWRIRVGIDNRNPEERVPGEKYVLENFSENEVKVLDEAIVKICKKLVTW